MRVWQSGFLLWIWDSTPWWTIKVIIICYNPLFHGTVIKRNGNRMWKKFWWRENVKISFKYQGTEIKKKGWPRKTQRQKEVSRDAGYVLFTFNPVSGVSEYMREGNGTNKYWEKAMVLTNTKYVLCARSLQCISHVFFHLLLPTSH